jgi:alpha-L-fucosidase
MRRRSVTASGRRALTAAAAAAAVVELGVALLPQLALAQYAPTWESLDSRPLPAWYDQAKIGIFIHWGVFSVPSFGVPSGGASGEWFWKELSDGVPAYVDFVRASEAPSFQYMDYAARFDAIFFNATQWLELFRASGAKYIVPTSKHHEGFCNWPSATSFAWNSMDVGPHRDLIGELANATRAAGLHFGVYHSMFEWFNPLYLADKAANFTTNSFVVGKTLPARTLLTMPRPPPRKHPPTRPILLCAP